MFEITKLHNLFEKRPCCPWLCPHLCTAKKNSSSSTANFQTSTKWTFPTFGLVYQVPNMLHWFFSHFLFTLGKCPLLLTHSHWCPPDKDQDGHFRWVDKNEVTFSNYGPGWPKNMANIWDCGQIFTGESPVKHWVEAASQSESTELLFCCRKLWRHVGNDQLLQEPGLHLWDDRRAEPQTHYHAWLVRLLRIDAPHLW